MLRITGGVVDLVGAQGSAGTSARGLEASIMPIDAKAKDVIWAYEVHHNATVDCCWERMQRGDRSHSACAKHLKEFNWKGK